MVILKHLRFRDLYNSNTLNAKSDWIYGKSGLLRGGDISVQGLTVTIQPMVFVQKGLVLETMDPANIAVSSETLARPHLLAVSVATNVQFPSEVLAVTIIARPEDASDQVVIVAEYDGTEYRKVPYLDIAGTQAYQQNHLVATQHQGVVDGSKTEYNAGVFTIDTGVVTNSEGLDVPFGAEAAFNQADLDPDYPNRIDEIVVRKNAAGRERPSFRHYVVGDAFNKTGGPTNITLAYTASDKIKRRLRKFTPVSAAGHIATYLDDYEDASALIWIKSGTDMQAFGAPVALGTYDDYGAAISEFGNLYYVARKNDDDSVLVFNQADINGALVGADVQIYDAPAAVTDIKIALDELRGRVYIFFREFNAGKYEIKYASINLAGASITTPLTIVATAIAGSIANFDVHVDVVEQIAFVSYEDTGRVFMKSFNLDSGNSVTPPSEFRNYGELSDDSALLVTETGISGTATNPRVVRADNKELYVFFRQVFNGSDNELFIWNEHYQTDFGWKALCPFTSSAGVSVDEFSVGLNTFNSAFFATVRASGGTQEIKDEKVDLYQLEVLHSVAIESATDIISPDVQRDRYGVISGGYIRQPSSVAEVNNGSAQDSLAFGPGSFNGHPLTSAQFVVTEANILSLPRPVQNGDTFLVTGAGANNGLAGTIQTMLVTNILGVDYYIFTTNQTFTYETGSISTQFYYLSGSDDVVLFKTPAVKEETRDVLTLRDIPTDVWVTRAMIRSDVAPAVSPVIEVFNRPDSTAFHPSIRNLYDLMNISVTDGGTTAWANTPDTFEWTSDINIYQHGREDHFVISGPGDVEIQEGQVAYVKLPPNPDSSQPLTMEVADSHSLYFDADGLRILPIVYRTNNRLYSRWADVMFPGEENTPGFGGGVPQDLLDFIGSTGESDNSPDYSSNNYVVDGDNLVDAISTLDSQLFYLASLQPEEEVFYIVGATTFITAAAMFWDSSNSQLDITVWKNGQKLQQELTAVMLNPASTEDYRKESNNQLKFAASLIPGDKIVIRRENASGGVGGTFIVKQGNVNVAVGINKLNFTGGGWTIVDAGSGQVDISFAGGGGGSSLSKSAYNNTGVTINAPSVLCWQNDGSVDLADANTAALSDFAGINLNSIPNGSYGSLVKGGNVAGVLAGLGATPGQSVFLGTTPGTFTLIPPSGPGDSVIKIGRAEPPDGVFTAVADDLFIEIEVLSTP